MDMSLIRLALRNVLANALKYSPPGTPVNVRVWDSDEPLALMIDVSDSGTGIQAELLPRLFSRGARGRRSLVGSGPRAVNRPASDGAARRHGRTTLRLSINQTVSAD